MAVHISNFGTFCTPILKQFADNDGYVPEYGDDKSQFNYDDNAPWLPGGFDVAIEPYNEGDAQDAWDVFVVLAVDEMVCVENEIRKWRIAEGITDE